MKGSGPKHMRYLFLLVVAVATGCQTTATRAPASSNNLRISGRSEKLLLRADKIVDTYTVSVQRVELVGENRTSTDDWDIIATAEVNGYPGSFRKSDGSKPVASATQTGSFLLDGAKVEVALDPGVQLVLKVEPELQNTAHLVGVFSQTRNIGTGMESFSLPFDIHCDLGKVVVLYEKETAAANRAGR